MTTIRRTAPLCAVIIAVMMTARFGCAPARVSDNAQSPSVVAEVLAGAPEDFRPSEPILRVSPAGCRLRLSTAAPRTALPLQQEFLAEVVGAPDSNRELHCGTRILLPGNGDVASRAPLCPPWAPGQPVERQFRDEYRYREPGTYQARYLIQGRNGDQAFWLASDSIVVVVR